MYQSSGINHRSKSVTDLGLLLKTHLSLIVCSSRFTKWLLELWLHFTSFQYQLYFKGIAKIYTRLKISAYPKTFTKWIQISPTDWEKIFTTANIYSMFDKDLYLESYHSKIRKQFLKWRKDLNRHFTGRQMGGQ